MGSMTELFWDTPTCCLDEDFSCKVKAQMTCALDLLRDDRLCDALNMWSLECRLSNMHTERLLSTIRRAVSKAPVADRLHSAGTLAQVASTHRMHGGDDPRSASRSQVLRIGAPLKTARRQKNPNMRRAHIEFVNKKRAHRRASGLQVDAAEFKDEFAGFSNEFHQLPPQVLCQHPAPNPSLQPLLPLKLWLRNSVGLCPLG
jgi:hypothetical protein